ncbi:MAG: response regulator transcription factor [Phaeodactylibacter sp.]|nr:response regulator transcription factor [Phaeodactylibacter sp.]
MTCLIIDDSPMARAALRSLIGEVDFLELAGECEDALSALKALQERPADLLFLDVEMPRMSGLELLDSLAHKPLVILITSKRDYAVEAFEYRVVDYLVKPVTYPRFVAAVQKARELFQQQDRKAGATEGSGQLFIKVNNALTRIVLEDVLFVQALGDYVTIVTRDKRHTVHFTMKEMEHRLPPARFVRTHRSYIVALDKIDNVEENSIAIGKNLIPVSESYRSAFFSRLDLL